MNETQYRCNKVFSLICIHHNSFEYVAHLFSSNKFASNFICRCCRIWCKNRNQITHNFSSNRCWIIFQFDAFQVSAHNNHFIGMKIFYFFSFFVSCIYFSSISSRSLALQFRIHIRRANGIIAAEKLPYKMHLAVVIYSVCQRIVVFLWAGACSLSTVAMCEH